MYRAGLVHYVYVDSCQRSTEHLDIFRIGSPNLELTITIINLFYLLT